MKEEMAVSLASGDLNINFIKAQVYNNHNIVIGEGCAYIDIKNGEIVLTCILNKFNSNILFRALQVDVQEIYPDDCFVTVQLEDFLGATWKTNKFIPHSLNILNHEKQIFINKINEIKKYEHITPEPYTYKYFFDKNNTMPIIDIQNYLRIIQQDRMHIDIGSSKIFFEENSSYSMIEIVSSTKISISKIRNIIAAISIATGQIFSPFYSISYEYPHKISTIYNKPQVNHIQSVFSYKNRAEDPFKYVVKAIESNIDLSIFVFLLERSILSQKVNFNMFCISICTGIEQIGRKYFYEYGTPSKIEESTRITELLLAIKKEDDTFYQRIKSSINNYRQFNIRTVFKKLHRLKVIDTNHLDAWSSLRNQVSHATSESTPQKKVNMAFKCLELFYLLHFIIIGYEGKYIGFNNDHLNPKTFIIPEELKAIDFSKFKIKE